MKALLTTIFRVPNFGSVLQAYATQFVLENMSIECSILNYDHNNSEWARRHGVKGTPLKSKIAQCLGIKPFHRKKQKLDCFIREHFHLTRKYTTLADIQRNEGKAYHIYVAGSDQIWNTKYTNCDPVFLLQYADEGKCRISLASSFATSSIDAKYKDTFQQELHRFHAVSVREALGQKALQGIGIKGSHIVMDPTLLLSKQEWNQVCKNVNGGGKFKGTYILLYMWCYAFEPRPYIYEVLAYYQCILGCPIVALEGYDKGNCKKHSLNVVDATDSSIDDFLAYFANASLVVTSSFHGTAFALNYGVPLISIVPDGGDDRQSSLLAQLQLAQCRLSVGETISHAQPFYDKEKEQEQLDALRKDSLNWIRNAIKTQ